MEKKARSYLELQHNARYYIGIDNNRVGPKQPSNRRVTDSRLLSAHHLFRWLSFSVISSGSSRTQKKRDKDRRELVFASAANFLDTNQASINPYLHWCGYLIRHPLERKKKKTRRAPFWNFLLSRPVVSPVKRFVRLGALNCVCARARTPRLRRFNWFARKKTGPPWCYSKRFQHCTLCRLSSSSSSSSRVEFSTLRPSRSCGFFLYLKCWPAFGVHHSNNIRRQRIISYSSRGSREGFTSVNRGEINTR